jgi:TctA family transporter
MELWQEFNIEFLAYTDILLLWNEYFPKILDCPFPMLEENLRRALVISLGDPSVFVTRPVSLTFVIVTILIILTMALPAVRKRSSKITG